MTTMAHMTVGSIQIPKILSRVRCTPTRIRRTALQERRFHAQRKNSRHQTSATERDALVEFALRDDYDPYAVFFCLNALFISVLLNILNFGLERNGDGNVSIPKGGLFVMLSRSRKGIFDYFMLPMKRVFLRDELKIAIEELEAAKSQAYLKRGTPAAEDAAQKFMSARKTALSLGLPEDSPLLSAKSPSELD